MESEMNAKHDCCPHPSHTAQAAIVGDLGTPAPIGHELRFESLYDEGRGYAFPCDAAGQVDLDVLSERARTSYFYARALIGRDYSMPAVRPRMWH